MGSPFSKEDKLIANCFMIGLLLNIASKRDHAGLYDTSIEK